MRNLIKSVLFILFISLIHYITMEFLNEKKFFDFTEANTVERIILSLFVATIIELSIKYKRKKSS